MNIDKVASLTAVALGAWLLVLSVLLWRAQDIHAISTGAVGATVVILGAISTRSRPWARWAIAPLALWLMGSVWFDPARPPTLVANHFTVGTLLFGFAVLPTGRQLIRPRSREESVPL